MNDNDIAELFAAAPVHDDAPVFAERVTRMLRFRLWLRQGLVVLAGFIGGVYALAQFIQLPSLKVTGGAADYGLTLQKAAVDSDQALRASAKVFDVAELRVMDMLGSWAHTLGLMQTPVYFWVTFGLCLAFLTLYYANSQEESI